ncbi:hypothetical protein D3C85_1383370 [compost metagenome]
MLVLQKLFLQQPVILGAVDALLGHRAFAAQFAVEVLQSVVQFDCGAFDSLVEGCGFMAYGNRLMAFWACLHLAAFVVGTRLVAVLVAQVDLDAGEVFVKSFERAFYGAADPLFQSNVALNMVVAIDLDLHSSIPYSASSQENRWGLCGL